MYINVVMLYPKCEGTISTTSYITHKSYIHRADRKSPAVFTTEEACRTAFGFEASWIRSGCIPTYHLLTRRIATKQCQLGHLAAFNEWLSKGSHEPNTSRSHVSLLVTMTTYCTGHQQAGGVQTTPVWSAL